jgi:hypothetical protein
MQMEKIPNQIHLDQIQDSIRRTEKSTKYIFTAAILMSLSCAILCALGKSSASMTALSAALCWSVYGIRCETFKYIQTLTAEIQQLKTNEE